MKARISVKFQANYTNVKLHVSTNVNLSNPLISSPYNTTDLIAKMEIDGLAPDTQYYYGVSVAGTLQTGGRGTFKTFPAGPSSFTCAFASCAQTGSNNAIFSTIRNLNPLFFIHMGDLHYADITTNNVSLFRDAYDTVFNASNQANLYANIPTMYTWDDHDFGNNDSWGASASRPAVSQAYKEFVPHYSLAFDDGSIGQTWVVGRVRFIMPDQMYHKTSPWVADPTNKTMMGEDMIQWFFTQLLQPEPLKIWVNDKPYVGNPLVDENGYESDKWWGYTTERTRIANFIKDNNLEGRVAIISGDTHCVAIDDGTNTGYATGGGGAIPVFQCAPLNRTGSTKGGPYSQGSYQNDTTTGEQFGIMNITDNGSTDPITMEWVGRRNSTTLVTWSMQVPSAPYTPPE